MFLNLSVHQNHLEGLRKHRLLGPTPEFLALEVGVGSPRLFISNRFPNVATAAGLRTTVWERLHLSER